MNGNLFYGLKNLQTVYIRGNECIDESFTDLNSTSTFTEIVSEKCGFCESDKPIEVEICSNLSETTVTETLTNETIEKEENYQLEISLKIHEIYQLRTELFENKNKINDLLLSIQHIIHEKRKLLSIIQNLEGKIGILKNETSNA